MNLTALQSYYFSFEQTSFLQTNFIPNHFLFFVYQIYNTLKKTPQNQILTRKTSAKSHNKNFPPCASISHTPRPTLSKQTIGAL